MNSSGTNRKVDCGHAVSSCCCKEQGNKQHPNLRRWEVIDDLQQAGKKGKSKLKKQSGDLERNVNRVWVVGTDRKNINACRIRKEAALQRCAINYWNRWVRSTSWNCSSEMAFWHCAGFVAEQMPLRKKWLLSIKKKTKQPTTLFLFLIVSQISWKPNVSCTPFNTRSSARKTSNIFCGNSRQNN